MLRIFDQPGGNLVEHRISLGADDGLVEVEERDTGDAGREFVGLLDQVDRLRIEVFLIDIPHQDQGREKGGEEDGQHGICFSQI